MSALAAGAIAQPLQPAPARPPSGFGQPAPGGPAKIYELEQIRTGPLPLDVQEKLKPVHTLQEAEELLKVNRIAFAWGVGEVRSSALPPAFVAQIDRLPPHEVFVIAQPNGAIIGVILRISREPAGAPSVPTPR